MDSIEHVKELHCNCYAYIHGHMMGGTNPALLILYHRGAGSADEYLTEIRRTYAGRVVAGNDLDVY